MELEVPENTNTKEFYETYLPEAFPTLVPILETAALAVNQVTSKRTIVNTSPLLYGDFHLDRNTVTWTIQSLFSPLTKLP